MPLKQLKVNLVKYYLSILVLSSSYISFSQQISVDNTVPLQSLILDNLVDGCVEISNITSSVNGIPHGLPSFGRFERGSSNFPFASGIVISTGNAASAGNSSIANTLSDSATDWGTDPDIETALGVTNTANATSIEFDFTSVSSEFRFNYLLASEEYENADNTCNSGDGFVFLIRELNSTAPFQNIALLPNTSDPVQVKNIRNEINAITCPARNETFFEGFNSGDTNFEGRTTVLTASTPITPYVTYRVKLIIADQPNDGQFDSAVFIEGDSFKILDLGDDINTCDSVITLNADINNPDATYQWFLDNSTSPITGETNAQLSVTSSGTYRVEVTVPLNNDLCTEEDEIVVNIQNILELDAISDFSICDDDSNGTEMFNLTSKDQDVQNIAPFVNFSRSYHTSRQDAESNSNAITTVTNTNTSEPIFVRIADTNSGCVAFSRFNIIASPLPVVTAVPLPICDGDNDPIDGFTTIDLTQKNDDITNANENLSVDSFHFNIQDAIDGINIIPNPSEYVNNAPNTETLHVRVRNINTGCINTTTLDITITNGPVINRAPFPLDACDSEQDGIATFDLTEAINDILNGLNPSDFTVTFHLNPDDANTGNSAIANSSNYENVIQDVQTIFVRVENNTTKCASVAPLEIHTNLLLTGTDTGAFGVCDDSENGDPVEFNLLTVERQILEGFADNDGNIPPNFEVNFFETEEDRDNNNPINKLSGYEVDELLTNVFITISNTDTNCLQPTEITLRVDPRLVFPVVDPQTVCDRDNNGTDGSTSIDLESFNALITDNRDNFTVLYFLDIDDANGVSTNPDPPLPLFYRNVSNPVILHARIESDQTTCTEVTTFEIEVIPPPIITQPTPITFCLNQNTPEATVTQVDIDQKKNEIIADPSLYEFNTFDNFSDADNIDNTTDGIINFPNTFNQGTNTIFIRVESTSPSGEKCFDIASLNIIVNNEPIIADNSPLTACEDDGDGIAEFILADFDQQLLGNQTGKEVLYYRDTAETDLIDKNSAYFNTDRLETIFIRIESISDPQGCSISESTTLQVAPNPVFDTTLFSIQECLILSNTSAFNFNLLEKTQEIQNSSPNPIIVTYFEDPSDAENDVNPISGDLEQYNITSISQTIYARVASDDNLCHIVQNLNLIVIETPEVTTPSPLAVCDDLNNQYDGIAVFDLETADFEILNDRFNNSEIQYFERFEDINQDDSSDITNAIPASDINNYTSTSKTIYIRVVNTSTQCPNVFPLELEVVAPPVLNPFPLEETCFSDTNSFDLSVVDDELINDPSTVNITYHSTPEDARSSTDRFVDNIFTYTTTGDTTIWASVRDITREPNCNVVTPFTLRVHPNPIANTPRNLIKCDDDFDNRLIFDLTERNSEILGNSQSATDYTISYYLNLEDAQNANNTLNVRFDAENNTPIFARIENNSTGCFDTTSFTLIVNPLPVIPIDDMVTLCLDDLPLIIDANTGNPNDSYLWQTNVNSNVDGAITSQITLTDASQIGDYNITVTTDNSAQNADSCSISKTFTVIESQQAIIDISTNTDFVDPNSITVEVSGIGDYRFSLDGEEPQESGFFPNVTLGAHIVTVIDLNGCTPIDTEVFVIDIPKFFTPNNDGFFDAWHIVGARQLPGSEIFIYNRHGKLLKMLAYNSPGWNGTYNGNPMPADDYWFSADIIQDGRAFKITGHFTLRR